MEKEKIITGYWDGEPIWRYKTGAEKLLELIQQNNEFRQKIKSKENE